MHIIINLKRVDRIKIVIQDQKNEHSYHLYAYALHAITQRKSRENERSLCFVLHFLFETVGRNFV